MSSDLLQSFIVVFAAISAMLLARFLVRMVARAQRAEAARRPSVTRPAPKPPVRPSAPQEVAIARSATATATRPVHTRPTRRLQLADARMGIVLATIVGPCRAHAPGEDHQ